MKTIAIGNKLYKLTEKEYKKALRMVEKTERDTGDNWFKTLEHIESKGKFILKIDNAFNY